MHVVSCEYLVFYGFRLSLYFTLAKYLEQESIAVFKLSIQSLEEEGQEIVSQLVG